MKLLLQECKITSKPVKFEKQDGGFSRLLFRGCHIRKKQDKNTKEWNSKNFYFQFIVFNEKLAEYVMSSYKENKLNYLTSHDCNMNDFTISEANVEGKNGTPYKECRYSNIQYVINDCIITHKEIKENSQENKEEVKETKENYEPEVVDDEIPF